MTESHSAAEDSHGDEVTDMRGDQDTTRAGIWNLAETTFLMTALLSLRGWLEMAGLSFGASLALLVPLGVLITLAGLWLWSRPTPHLSRWARSRRYEHLPARWFGLICLMHVVLGWGWIALGTHLGVGPVVGAAVTIGLAALALSIAVGWYRWWVVPAHDRGGDGASR